MLIAQFDWTVAKSGYGWVETDEVDLQKGRGKSGSFLTNDWNADSPLGLGGVVYQPMSEHTGLCRTLADTPLNRDGVLTFANRYGPLLGSTGPNIILPHRPGSAGGKQLGRGEKLDTWYDAILHLQLVCSIWDQIRNRDLKKLAQHVRWRNGLVEFETHPHLPDDVVPLSPFIRITRTLAIEEQHPALYAGMVPGDVITPAYRFIQHIVNQKLDGCGSPRMLWDEADGQMLVRLVPKNLLGAIWLQMAHAIERNGEFRRCAECDRWFEVSREGGRSDKIYCSNACRVKAHRQRLTGQSATPARSAKKIQGRRQSSKVVTTRGRFVGSKRKRR